jgi:hypothetical protein
MKNGSYLAMSLQLSAFAIPALFNRIISFEILKDNAEKHKIRGILLRADG